MDCLKITPSISLLGILEVDVDKLKAAERNLKAAKDILKAANVSLKAAKGLWGTLKDTLKDAKGQVKLASREVAFSVATTVKPGRVILDEQLKNLDGSTLVKLTALVHHREPMKDMPRYYHAFLQICFTDTNSGREWSVKAEKTYYEEEGLPLAEGRINIVLFPKEDFPKNMNAAHIAPLEGCGNILWSTLRAILEESYSSRYNIWSKNCARFANETFMKILKELIKLPDTSEECKEKLIKCLEKVRNLKKDLPVYVLKLAAKLSIALFLCAFPAAILGTLCIVFFRGDLAFTVAAVYIICFVVVAAVCLHKAKTVFKNNRVEM